MDKVRLEVLGISYSQTQAGAYALILSVGDSTQRIPIIIGGFEAQAIAIELEKIKPPRPLTHDLFHKFSNLYEINLKEVFIYKLEEGVFYSKLLFNKDNQITTIDARTSDAITLALKFNSPIYTTEAIVEKAGIILNIKEDKRDEKTQAKKHISSKKEDKKIFNYSLKELEKLMTEAINREDYEKASLIRDEINKRKNEK